MTDIYPIKPIILEPYKFTWIIFLAIFLLALVVKNLLNNKQTKKQINKKEPIKLVNKLKKLLHKLDKVNMENKKVFYKQLYSIIIESLEAIYGKKFKNYSLTELNKFDILTNDISKIMKKVYLQVYTDLPDSLEERKEILIEIRNVLESFIKANANEK